MGRTRQLVEAVWQAFDGDQLDRLPALLDADVEWDMSGMVAKGVDDVAQMLGVFRRAFSDVAHRGDGWVEGPDRVAVQVRVTSRHTGPFPTPQGPLAPTGRPVVWEAGMFAEAGEGGLVRLRSYFDQLAVLQQLGALPAPSGPDS